MPKRKIIETKQHIKDSFYVEATLYCDAQDCHMQESYCLGGEDEEAVDHFYKNGWRADDQSCYCPIHAKKLKP